MQHLPVEPSKLVSLLEAVANLSPDPKQVYEAVTLCRLVHAQGGSPIRTMAWLMPAAA